MLVMTLAIRTLARRRGWMHQPGTRSDSRQAGASPGRRGDVCGVRRSWRWWWRQPYDLALAGLLGGATVIVGVMLVDDIRGLRPRDKFLAQLVAAAIPLACGIRIDAVSNPFGGVIDLPLVIVVPFTLVLDRRHDERHQLHGWTGRAGGRRVDDRRPSAGGALQPTGTSRRRDACALALAAVSLGFLPLNFYRASIIMGDSGSHFLGFSLAVIAILGTGKDRHGDAGARRPDPGSRLVHRASGGPRAGA